VRQALQRQTGKGLVIVEPKSAAGRRTISLPCQFVDALRQHRIAQLEERMAAANNWQDHGLVFAQPNGRPLDPRSDLRVWRALLTPRQGDIFARSTDRLLALVIMQAPRTTLVIRPREQKARSGMVGPVGLEPTTYGLKEDSGPVQRPRPERPNASHLRKRHWTTLVGSGWFRKHCGLNADSANQTLRSRSAGWCVVIVLLAFSPTIRRPNSAPLMKCAATSTRTARRCRDPRPSMAPASLQASVAA
jgi:hypothetical protein